VKPYTDYILSDTTRVRKFDERVAHGELVWHEDEFSREITVVASNNWQLQMDNNLPTTLVEGETYSIPKSEYHRLIRGLGPLVIIIKEDKEGNDYGI